MDWVVGCVGGVREQKVSDGERMDGETSGIRGPTPGSSRRDRS